MSEAAGPGQEHEEETEWVVTTETSNPHKIETGDSIKVKQVLDDATVEAVTSVCGYTPDYKLENLKLWLMFISCVFAMVAQFYPLPFPESRPLLGVCCASYGLLSAVLQFMITFVDKDTVLLTKSSEKYPVELRIRTNFPRFQDEFSLTVQRRDYVVPKGGDVTTATTTVTSKDKEKAGIKKDKDTAKDKEKEKEAQGVISTVKMYVGRYFTKLGEFDEERFHHDVKMHLQKLEKCAAPREYSLGFKDKSD